MQAPGQSPVYLDHNATTPMPETVRTVFASACARFWGNPSSAHAAGRAAQAAMARGRAQVAALGGWRPRAVYFTSGATESNAWVLQGWRTEDRPLVVGTAVEHPSVRAWCAHLLPVDGDGRVLLDALDALLAEHAHRIAVVSVMAANNETGVLQPVDQVAARLAKAGVRFHCDATQLPGKLPVQVQADAITLSSHKLGGPRGIGALVVPGDPPRPLVLGGGQERGSRAGTANVPGVVGFGAAAAMVQERGPIDPAQRDALERGLVALGGRVVGQGAPRLPNTSLVQFDVAGDLLVMALDLQGVQVSAGSACHSGSHQASAVLAAMGLTGAPVRFSLGAAAIDVPAVLDAVDKVLQQAEAACGS